MKKETKIALIVIGSVIALGGIGTWLYLRSKNRKKLENENNNQTDDTNVVNESYTPPSSSSSNSSSSSVFPIKKGSPKNKYVMELQKLLICAGNLPNNPNEADGNWGSKTEAAMKKSPVNISVLKNINDYNMAIGRLNAATRGGTQCK